MTAALLLLLALAEPKLSVTTLVDPATPYLHQPVRVTLRITYDEKFFRESAVQMFPRELALPIKVEADWLNGTEGTISFALNDEVAFASRVAPGVVEIARVFVPKEAGELALAAPVVRYAFATKFRDDFVHGRIPLDRKDVRVVGDSVSIPVRTLPEEGKPARFGGAVGLFSVEVGVSKDSVKPNEIFQLVVRVEGEGNLAEFDAPGFKDLDGFHIYGVVDDRATPRRTITYEIAALDASVRMLPPVVLPFFEPGAAKYWVRETHAIPLDVRGVEAPVEEPTRWWIGVALVVIAVVGTWQWRRTRPSDSLHPAAEAFAAGGSFESFLATLLGCPEAAVISPELAARLEADGIDAALARRAADLVEQRVGSRYGGAASGDGSAERALVEAITASRRVRPGS